MEKFIHNIAMEVEIQRQPTKMKELPYLTSEYNYERINFAKNRMQECRTLARRLIMKIFNLSSKQIITWICVNYGLFILAFFTLGFMGSKSAVIINFVLDVVLCVISFALNIGLFSTKYKTPIVGKIGLLFATLCFVAFTYFAFLMPENGLPPVLFS